MQVHTMIDDLESKYESLVKREMDPRIFIGIIKKNKDLRDLLIERSKDLDSFYDSPSELQRIHYIFNSTSIETCSCGFPRTWRNFTKGYNKTCGSQECVSLKNKESVKSFYLEKYGCEHFSLTEEFKKKFKETSMSRYGVDNPWKSEEVKEKIRKTNIEKYGESNYLKVDKNKKALSDKIKRYSEEKRIELIKEYSIPIEIIEFISGSNVKIRCLECKTDSDFSSSFFNKKIASKENPCLKCNPPLYSESAGENQLYEFIRSIYQGEIIYHDRKTLNGKEIDIYLPELSIGFEFDGIYWHSEYFKEKYGNLKKKELIKAQGISIYNIWEDDWIFKNEIIKSRIINSLGLSKKIGARKCEILTVSSKEEKEFLNNNHIQGYVPSSIKIGLYYNNQLVSLITFSKNRKAVGKISVDGEYELLRFCNKLNTSVVGGASKLFKYFIEKKDPDLITSYQDNSWHTGNLYQNLGFIQYGSPEPNYYWCKKNMKFHRYNFRKDKLVKQGFDPSKTEDQIMHERGYYKLWGFGNLKWVYKK